MGEPRWDAQVVYERQESYDMAAGPYGYEKVGVRFNDRVIWLGLRGYGVPEHMASEWSDAVRLANLLAAAPDLYEALELAVEKLREYADMDRWSQGEGGGCMSDPDEFIREAVEKAEVALRRARGA